MGETEADFRDCSGEDPRTIFRLALEELRRGRIAVFYMNTRHRVCFTCFEGDDEDKLRDALVRAAEVIPDDDARAKMMPAESKGNPTNEQRD